MIRKLPIIFLLLLLSIIGLHLIGNNLNWYFTKWWFDVLLHFMGGIWLFIFYLYLIFSSKYILFQKLKYKSIFKNGIIFLFIISIFWEIFEYILGVSLTKDNYVIDTIIDLIMDISGGTLIYLLLKKEIKNG